MPKKDCAFQYALGNPGLLQKGIIEDTDLITYDEAKKLWEKYLADFKRRLDDGEEPEMVIWVDMENNTHYNNDKYHLGSRDGLEFYHSGIYATKKVLVEMPE